MFPFPTFCFGGDSTSTLTAAPYFGGVIGYFSSAFRAVAGDPGPAIGSLEPSPTAATWDLLGTGELLLEGEPADQLLVYLAGDQTGHFSGKTLTVGSQTYTSAELISELYLAEFGVTAFTWLAKEMLADGNQYTVTVS